MRKQIQALLQKYRELILYIVFGVLTTAVNWAVYAGMVRVLQVDLSAVPDTNVVWEMLAGNAGQSLSALFVSNFIAWVAGVLVAFVTNKLWVFKSRIHSFSGVAKELALFVSARILSGVFEWFGTPLLVMLGMRRELFGVEGFSAKILISVIVVVLNYILSKALVFRKKK